MILVDNSKVRFEGKIWELMAELDCAINAFISDFGMDTFKTVLEGAMMTDEEIDESIKELTEIIGPDKCAEILMEEGFKKPNW